MQDLAERSGLTADLVRHWFSTKAKATVAHTTAIKPGVAAELPAPGPCPLEPQPEGGLEKKMVQMDCSLATQAKEATTDKILNTAKGTLLFSIKHT